jgi:hypothetical protein
MRKICSDNRDQLKRSPKRPIIGSSVRLESELDIRVAASLRRPEPIVSLELRNSSLPKNKFHRSSSISWVFVVK